MFGFGLKFGRRATEREYMRWMIERRLRRGEGEVLCAMFGLCCAYSVRFALNEDARPHVATLLLSVVYLAWELAARRRMSVEEFAARRTTMVIRTRLLIDAVNWVIDPPESVMPITSLWSECIINGIVVNTMMAWCLPLKFHCQFPVQIATTTALLLFSTRYRCVNLMETSGAASVKFMASVLDSWAKRIMIAMYGQCSDEPLICPCLHVMVFLHVFVVLILGSYLFCKLEWSSRRAFIRTLPEQRRQQERLSVGFEDTFLIRSMHAFLFVVAFAITWELNYFSVAAINAWGL